MQQIIVVQCIESSRLVGAWICVNAESVSNLCWCLDMCICAWMCAYVGAWMCVFVHGSMLVPGCVLVP